MANEIFYQCSNCGKTEQTRAMLGVPDGMFYAGYRAHGDVLYCPDCVKTWKERNGAENEPENSRVDVEVCKKENNPLCMKKSHKN